MIAPRRPPPPPEPRRDWRAYAACIGTDLELWFPVGSTGRALEQIAQAKAICARCEVCAECSDWALSTGQDDGIWGGLTEDERRSLRPSRQRQSAR